MAYAFLDGGLTTLTLTVGWSPVDAPAKQTWARFYLGRAKTHFYALNRDDLAFSPDSKYLAVLAGGHAWIIDLAKHRSLRIGHGDEFVGSFAWTSPNEFVYVVHEISADEKRPNRGSRKRTFWLQRVQRGPAAKGQPLSARTAVHEEQDVVQFLDRSGEKWSPNGKYAIVCSCGFRGLRLFDLSKRSARDIGRKTIVSTLDLHPGHLFGVEWSPDGERAFCITRDVSRSRTDEGEANEAILVDAPAGEVLDLKEQFTGFFEPQWLTVSSMEWTVDGKGCLVQVANKTSDELFLITPRPWHVARVKGDNWRFRFGYRQFSVVLPDGKRLAVVDEQRRLSIRPREAESPE
ncbi:MAG: WD40 repeat domain-containing protein [Planctomycetota bacterium]